MEWNEPDDDSVPEETYTDADATNQEIEDCDVAGILDEEGGYK